MKSNYYILAFLPILFIGCEKANNEGSIPIEDSLGVSIYFDGVEVVHSNDIAFYDASTHLFYLKDTTTVIDSTDWQSFQVFADGVEIYSGKNHSMFNSLLPVGSYIQCNPAFYGNFIIPIKFEKGLESLTDPRNDSRIITALEKTNQISKGLSCEFVSIKRLNSTSVSVDLMIKNLGEMDLYILDPVKMGNSLYHYYTNGIVFGDSEGNLLYCENYPTRPEPSNKWDSSWLSLLKSGESRKISLNYTNFRSLELGTYTAYFSFPGLSHQVRKEELQDDGAYIWLGEIKISKEITFK